MPEPLMSKEQEKIIADITACMAQYGHESNIPINHPYWNWIARLRLIS